MKKDGRRIMDGQTLKIWLERNMMDLYRTPENTDSSQRLYFFTSQNGPTKYKLYKPGLKGFGVWRGLEGHKKALSSSQCQISAIKIKG